MTNKNKKNNTERPLVSIITPSYNQGAFIRETIESVRAQDYPDIEYIVIDGGSTDSTLEILKSYGKDLQWISEKDNGQSDAINKGFAAASGEILAWLNSDDTYRPGAISRVVELFSSEPETDIVYGDTDYTDHAGKVIGQYPVGPFDYKKLAVANPVCQPSTFFKRSAWERAGGLDLSLNFTMDYDLWIRFAKTENFSFLHQVLSTYRLHDESKTASPKYNYLMHKEILRTVMRHYRWAPVNRVYAYCNHLIKEKTFLKKDDLPTITLSILLSFIKYMTFNNGVPRLSDIKMLTPGNIKKIMRGHFGGASEYDI